MIIVLLLIAFAVAGAAAWWAWETVNTPFQGYPGTEIVQVIDPGTSARAVLRDLESRGIVANADLARLFLVHRLGDPHIQAGEFRFSGPATTPQVLNKLIRGEVVTYPVTIVEGLTMEETAQELATREFGDYEKFLEAMSSPAAIADLDPEATNLEGYLFPDTYSFARGTSEHEIVSTMVRTFRQRFEGQVRSLISPDSELTIRDLVTLASLVEKEAQLDEERPVIAGVYANRLRKGMLLQADPTVIFALKLAGEWDGNIRRPDLKFDSPYNTYRYPALPPGPIASPGLASLVAAAAPAEVPYIYFVSRNDGSHVFAKTLSEHNRNVYEWQKLYWKKRWAEERRQQDQGL